MNKQKKKNSHFQKTIIDPAQRLVDAIREKKEPLPTTDELTVSCTTHQTVKEMIDEMRGAYPVDIPV